LFYRARSSVPDNAPLIFRFKTLLGLKTMTRRGEIGTSSPVLGFLPIRSPLERMTNDPNDDNLTDSPRSKQSEISWMTISTKSADSVRDRPTFWYTASHKSARVTVFPPSVSAMPFPADVSEITNDPLSFEDTVLPCCVAVNLSDNIPDHRR
jgi:hypothetical protein